MYRLFHPHPSICKTYISETFVNGFDKCRHIQIIKPMCDIDVHCLSKWCWWWSLLVGSLFNSLPVAMEMWCWWQFLIPDSNFETLWLKDFNQFHLTLGFVQLFFLFERRIHIKVSEGLSILWSHVSWRKKAQGRLDTISISAVGMSESLFFQSGKLFVLVFFHNTCFSMQTYKFSTTVVLLLPRACRLSRQQFLASMKSLLLCIEMLGLRNSKHRQHMQNDREYCSLVTIFIGWNFGWGPSLLKSTGVSGFHCERGCEKMHDLFYGFCRVGRNFMDHHAFVRVGTQNHQDTLFKQSPLFSESATKYVKDSVLILTHQKAVEVSLLGQQADISKQNDRNDEQSISRSRWLFDVFPCL